MASSFRFFPALKTLRNRPISNCTRFYSVLIRRKCLIIKEQYSNIRKIQSRNFDQPFTFDNEVEGDEHVEEKEKEQKMIDNLEADKSVVAKRLFESFIREFVEGKLSSSPNGYFSEENCRNLRSSVIKNDEAKKSSLKIGERSIDSRILQTLISENLSNVAVSYVKFLDKHNLFNPASAILTAEILYKLCKDKLVDESYVLRFSDEILNAKYAMFFKVSPMAQLFCLAPTSRWHEALEIFNNSPSLKKNAHCYFMVSACLIEQNRFREAFELFNNFLDFDLVVPEKSHHTVSFHESALNFILKLSSDVRKKSAAFSNFVQYVDLLYDIRCSGIPSDLVQTIEEIFRNLGNNYIIENSRIVDDRCTICNQKLQSEELTSDDFALMRRQVLHHLIKGDDVFRNSNPAEMQSFLRFVERNKPFELALDALNLAFAGVGRRMLSKDRPNRLVNIVRNLKKNFRAKKPCVVVRKHFFRDSETDLEQINKLAHVYLLDDKTSDDPFILYAALSSGQSCYVISNDTYAFLNETLDLKTRSLFLRWRRTRLIGNFYVTLEGVPKITIPPRYSVRCQRSADRFHLPLINRSDFTPQLPSKLDVVSPCSWLCIRKK